MDKLDKNETKVVPPTGFEPVTSSLPMTRSTAGAMDIKVKLTFVKNA